jgi:DNA-binding HxlR family transcriptional regulator
MKVLSFLSELLSKVVGMKKIMSATEMALRVIGRKGTFIILETLLKGPARFTTLEKVLKVSPRTLSERLKELEEQGVVNREAFPEVPPRVEYSLTEKGEALKPLLDSVGEWAVAFDKAKKKAVKKK